MFVSTKGNRGHTHTFTASWGARKKASLANQGGEASDRGRDAAAGRLGGESGATTRGDCQTGVATLW